MPLRKAMGKRLRDKLDHMKPKACWRPRTKRWTWPEKCLKIWTDWEKFASYAFNKSHATCYSLGSLPNSLSESPTLLNIALSWAEVCRTFTDIHRNLWTNVEAMGKLRHWDRCKWEVQPEVTVNHDGDIRFETWGRQRCKIESCCTKHYGERRKKWIPPPRNLWFLYNSVNLSASTKKNLEMSGISRRIW